jgi:hypothetical protein
MATCEEAYFAEYDTFTALLNAMGFVTIGANQRYGYTVVAATNTFTATATSVGGGIKTGAGDDVWTMNQSRILTNITNACQN